MHDKTKLIPLLPFIGLLEVDQDIEVMYGMNDKEFKKNFDERGILTKESQENLRDWYIDAIHIDDDTIYISILRVKKDKNRKLCD